MKSDYISAFGILLVCISILSIQSSSLPSSQVIPRDLFNASKALYPFNLAISTIGIIIGFYLANKSDSMILRIFAFIVGIVVILSGILSALDIWKDSLVSLFFQIIIIYAGLVVLDYGTKLKIAIGPVNLIKKIK